MSSKKYPEGSDQLIFSYVIFSFTFFLFFSLVYTFLRWWYVRYLIQLYKISNYIRICYLLRFWFLYWHNSLSFGNFISFHISQIHIYIQYNTYKPVSTSLLFVKILTTWVLSIFSLSTCHRYIYTYIKYMET